MTFQNKGSQRSGLYQFWFQNEIETALKMALKKSSQHIYDGVR